MKEIVSEYDVELPDKSREAMATAKNDAGEVKTVVTLYDGENEDDSVLQSVKAQALDGLEDR